VDLKLKLKTTSNFAFEQLQGIRGITPVKPRAAMYMMVGIEIAEFKDIEDDLDFAKKLLNEACVLVFPSQCFFAKNFFRIIICTSQEQIQEFTLRLKEFCAAHYK